GPAGPPGA
nr:Chain P, INHIBITOR PEPTIDE [synthetic construct]1EAK_R Chain R, INHIBITOR PEPTIDE [synthetic construct]